MKNNYLDASLRCIFFLLKQKVNYFKLIIITKTITYDIKSFLGYLSRIFKTTYSLNGRVQFFKILSKTQILHTSLLSFITQIHPFIYLKKLYLSSYLY